MTVKLYPIDIPRPKTHRELQYLFGFCRIHFGYFLRQEWDVAEGKLRLLFKKKQHRDWFILCGGKW